jgi:hypothetical protein
MKNNQGIHPMKITKLTTKGFGWHIIFPIFIIIAVTGVGVQLINKSSADSVNCTASTYKAGAADNTTHCVQDIQEMLNAVNSEARTVNNGGRTYAGSNLSISGSFTASTAAQVAVFNKYTALGTSSELSPTAWDKLCAYASNGETPTQRAGASASSSFMQTGAAAAINAECPAIPEPTKLVSLGGSIDAGLGLSPTLSIIENGSSIANATEKTCGRSTASAPYLEAQEKGLQLVQVACSGATSSNVLNIAQGTTQSAQLSLVSNDIKDNDVSVSFLGANDIDWIGDQITCLTSLNGCKDISDSLTKTYGYDANGYPAVPTGALTQLSKNITSILTDLKNEGASKIVVDRYYAVTQGDPGCLYAKGIAKSEFTSGDYTWMQNELAALNAAISLGATNANVGAIVLSPSFNNHGVCEPKPWVAAPGLADGAAMHPTYSGQQDIASLNESVL